MTQLLALLTKQCAILCTQQTPIQQSGHRIRDLLIVPGFLLERGKVEIAVGIQ